jgi:CRP-like cAMP-binding protein
MENKLFDYLSKYITLSEEEKKAITDLDIFKAYKKGTVLLKEGQQSQLSYFVIEGCVRSYFVIDGEEKTTAFYVESEAITPLCFVNKMPSEYYIACVEDCTLLVSTPEMEKIIFEKFPRFESLCRVLSEELLAKNQASYDDYRIYNPEQRYLNLLETRPDLFQRVPQYQMASYLGITPQSLSRLRKRLTKTLTR